MASMGAADRTVGDRKSGHRACGNDAGGHAFRLTQQGKARFETVRASIQRLLRIGGQPCAEDIEVGFRIDVIERPFARLRRAEIGIKMERWVAFFMADLRCLPAAREGGLIDLF